MEVARRLAALSLLVGVCAGATDALGQVRSRAYEPIAPIEAPSGLDPRKVELGRRLFHDPILSRDGTLSCASCHDLERGGVDGQAHSTGVGGAVGEINAPTVFNAALNIRQFWDGRVRTLEAQVSGPVTNPIEMAADWPGVIARLKASPHAAAFREAYGAEPSPETVSHAVAEFERSLVTVDSRFDRWLRGNEAALSPEEKRGYALFKSYGCASCHQGAAVGGNMFSRFGFFGSPFADGEARPHQGRFAVTGRSDDRHVFKVPSLRMAVLTAPYFHDGSVAELSEAVALMGRHQLGRDIPPEDIGLIVEFLGSLPGRPAGTDREPPP